jgi:hypothetical protein
VIMLASLSCGTSVDEALRLTELVFGAQNAVAAVGRIGNRRKGNAHPKISPVERPCPTSRT